MKNSGNELKQVLENKGRGLENELKTNSKRTHFECRMRALNAEFELFNAARVLAEDQRGGTRNCTTGGSREARKNTKIVGTNSIKYLKKNYIPLLNTVNCARFWHKSTPARRQTATFCEIEVNFRVMA